MNHRPPHPLENERFFWGSLLLGTLAAVGLALALGYVIAP